MHSQLTDSFSWSQWSILHLSLLIRVCCYLFILFYSSPRLAFCILSRSNHFLYISIFFLLLCFSNLLSLYLYLSFFLSLFISSSHSSQLAHTCLLNSSPSSLKCSASPPLTDQQPIRFFPIQPLLKWPTNSTSPFMNSFLTNQLRIR